MESHKTPCGFVVLFLIAVVVLLVLASASPPSTTDSTAQGIPANYRGNPHVKCIDGKVWDTKQAIPTLMLDQQGNEVTCPNA